MLRKLKLIYKFFYMFRKEFRWNLPLFITSLSWFMNDYRKLTKPEANPHFTLSSQHFYPIFSDKRASVSLDYDYFYQDTWAAGRIALQKPQKHYDVGSNVKSLGVISQFVPTTMIDIRAVDVTLENFSFLQGSILSLPLTNHSVESISSLCVVEHVGLGRYGDPADPQGSEKAIRELCRVVAPGGSLYISVPVDRANIIYFNAHRAFTREYLLSLTDTEMKLSDEKYVYQNKQYEAYDPQKGFGTGLFHFIKNK